MKKYFKILMCIAVIALSFTACQSKSDDKPNDSTTKKTEEKKEGANNYKDTLNIAVTAQPPTLDPVMTASNLTLAISNNFYETLFTFDENYNQTPMLAESYTKNDNNTEFTFKLRKGIKFHNDKEMKADDVASSMNYWLTKSERAKNLIGEGKFEKVDDYTVKATFKQPANDLMNLMCSQPTFPAIRPKESIESAGEKGVTELIGTGPYKVKEVKQDQYIMLEKFEGYQSLDSEPSGFAGKKEAPTKNLKYHIVPDQATRLNGLNTGTYDIIDDISNDNYEQLKANNQLKLYTQPGGTLNLFMNTTKGVFANKDMRLAIMNALDCDEIMLASFINKDLYFLDNGFMNPKTQWKTDAGKENYNTKNIEKAKELIKKAGYNGEKIRLVTTKDYVEMYNATVVVQDQLKKIGLNAEVVNFDFPTFMDNRSNTDKFDIFITSNSYQVTPQQSLIVNPDWAGHKDPKLKELVSSIQQAKDEKEAVANWEKTQKFIYTDYVSTLNIGHYNSVAATNKNVEDFVFFYNPIVWNAKVAK